MAITKCEECGQDVAEAAKRGMNCGTEGPSLKREESEHKDNVYPFLFFCAIFVVGWLVFLYFDFDSDLAGVSFVCAIFAGGGAALCHSTNKREFNIIVGVGIAVLVFIYFDELRDYLDGYRSVDYEDGSSWLGVFLENFNK